MVHHLAHTLAAHMDHLLGKVRHRLDMGHLLSMARHLGHLVMERLL